MARHAVSPYSLLVGFGSGFILVASLNYAGAQPHTSSTPALGWWCYATLANPSPTAPVQAMALAHAHVPVVLRDDADSHQHILYIVSLALSLGPPTRPPPPPPRPHIGGVCQRQKSPKNALTHLPTR